MYYVLAFFVLVPKVLAEEGTPETPLNRLDKTAREGGAGFFSTTYHQTAQYLPIYLGTITRSAMALLGVIFFALMVYGGFLWLYAGGNDEQVTKAKSIIVRALIGFIIVIFAGGITQFVLYYAGR